MTQRTFWQAPCGCYKSDPKPSRMPWGWSPSFYRPNLRDLFPIGLGGDEFCRRTIWFGWNFLTGLLIVPLWHCKGCEDCGDTTFDYITGISSEEEANRKLDYYED